MKVLIPYLIGLVWLPAIALLVLWAGFMPFPTRPEEIGRETNSYDGSTRSGFTSLISSESAKNKARSARYGLGQWYCESDSKEVCHLYEVTTEPFFGLVQPNWVLVVTGAKMTPNPIAFYGTYAACKWSEDRTRNKDEDERVSYERWATEHHQEVERRDSENFSCDPMPR